MEIAGVWLLQDDVLELMELLRRSGFTALCVKLEGEGEVEAHILGLTIDERGQVLRVLDDPPTAGLAGLRDVLIRDFEWYSTHGLV